MSETDRVPAYADLLFDLLAPGTPERHRALVRLEDIDPTSDPEQLRAAADYLHSEGIPFGFGVVPRYRDPTGSENDGDARRPAARLADVVAAIRYMKRKGGVLVEHGYTRVGRRPEPLQRRDRRRRGVLPREGRPAAPVRYDGPLPGDTSPAWADRRIAFANREFEAARPRAPAIFEFPHYAASADGYAAARRRFATRWERSFYFSGVLSGGRIDHRRHASQFFPYVVRDVYGSKVLPENLGSVNPARWHTYRSRPPEDILRAARANLVVRDGSPPSSPPLPRPPLPQDDGSRHPCPWLHVRRPERSQARPSIEGRPPSTPARRPITLLPWGPSLAARRRTTSSPS